MTDVLKDGLSDIHIVDHMGSDESVVRAARVSYAGDERTGVDKAGDARLINYLARNGHTSPFEHTYVTFHVKCPLFVRSQWHRHRMWSYNEISRRYTSEDIEFYYPQELRLQDTKNKQSSHGTYIGEEDYLWYMKDAVRACTTLYDKMIDEGIAREQARMVLPQNLYTRFYASANLHSISKFLKERMDEHAQYEIRVYAEEMYRLVKELYPVSLAAMAEGKVIV